MLVGEKVTLWKSDYKDFKGLWYAATYCKSDIVKRGRNFIVFEGCNPYDVLRYPTIQKQAEELPYKGWLSFCNEIKEDLTEREKEQLEKIKERVDNLEVDMPRVASQISEALVYPKGHIIRQRIFTLLAGERY